MSTIQCVTFDVEYLGNHCRESLASTGPPIGNGRRGIEWSRDRWCYVTQKGQTSDSNMLISVHMEHIINLKHHYTLTLHQDCKWDVWCWDRDVSVTSPRWDQDETFKTTSRDVWSIRSSHDWSL